MAARPLLVLPKTIVQENLEEREELVALRGNDGVNAEEGVEVEEVGEAERGRDGIDDLTDEAYAVLNVPAVLVCALVRVGLQELV